jgi:membrane protein DedA with SNARE-associated domain
MDVMATIADYGEWFYLVTLVWTFLEGETFVLFAGLAASKGLLRLDLLILFAWTGSFLGDQFYFLLGRRYGTRVLAWAPRWQAAVALPLSWLERYDTIFVLTYRFIYGVRNLSSLALGLSDISWRRFLVLNFIGAGIWAVVFASVGYLAGAAIERILGELHFGFQIALLAVVVALVAVAILRHRRRQAQAAPVASTPQHPG